MNQFFTDINSFILDTLFPITCLVCGQEGAFVCRDCLGSLDTIESQQCIVCQRASVGGLTHPYCQSPQAPDGLVSLFNYHDDNVAQILIYAKYKFLPGGYEPLAGSLAHFLQTEHRHLLNNYTLVPVPLATSRKRWRGFNQASIICKNLSEILQLPVADILVRKKHTKTQKDLKKPEREKNMAEAFALRHKMRKPWHQVIRNFLFESPTFIRERMEVDIKRKNFILIDDVVTTGATLAEAAKVLKRNGAGKVWCLTLARD